MDCRIDKRRPPPCGGITCRRDERIGLVLAMENAATTRPAPYEFAIFRFTGDIGKSAEVAEGERWSAPTVEAQSWASTMLEQRFVNRHVHRGANRRTIFVDQELFKQHRPRFARAPRADRARP